jgi:hypothetical protein
MEPAITYPAKNIATRMPKSVNSAKPNKLDVFDI